MANGHGGSRTPANPAPVSGPGSLSRRTDGGPGQPIRDPGGLPYGENQALHQIQAAAPMAGANAVRTPTPNGAAVPAAITPFDAPTTNPNQPLTAGAGFGAGPGPEVLPRPDNDRRQKLRQIMPVLMRMADLEDTPPATRNAIRYLRGVL